MSKTMQIAGYKSVITKKNGIIDRLTEEKNSLIERIKELTPLLLVSKTNSSNKVIGKTQYKTGCESKQMLREHTAERVSNLKGLAISLPGEDPLTEKETRKLNTGLRFIGIEMVPERHRKLVQLVNNERLYSYIKVAKCSEIGEFIRDKKNKIGRNSLALALLDFCWTFQKSKHYLIDLIERDVLKKGGKIFLTMDARSKGGKIGVESAIEKILSAEGNGRYKLEHITGCSKLVTYKDTSAMHFCEITRIK